MEEKRRPIKKWVYWFLFAVAVIAVYKTLDNFEAIGNWLKGLASVLMPFIIAILISYLLYIPCRKVENFYLKAKKLKFVKKKARALSVATVYLIVITIIAASVTFLIPVITDSITDFVTNFQTYYNETMQGYANLPEDSILKNEAVQDLITSIQNIDFKQFVNLEKIADYAKGAINVASKIFDFFVAIIVSVYILLQRREILEFLRKLGRATLKENSYQNMEKYFDRTNTIFFNFLAGQFLDGIVVGIITSIAMSIIGVKYAILLGFMIGLFNMIPYFGAIIAVIIAVIITILTGGLGQAILMLIVVVILQQIDANIINPKIIGSSLKISPLLVIFAVTFGGAYFGVWGMFLAVPVIAVLKLIVTDYIEYKDKIKSKPQKNLN